VPNRPCKQISWNREWAKKEEYTGEVAVEVTQLDQQPVVMSRYKKINTDSTLRAALLSPSRRCKMYRPTREKTMDRIMGIARREYESREQAVGDRYSVYTH
jgi:hypothetical protein